MDKKINPQKIKWTRGMALISFCLVVLAILIDNIKEPLFGLKAGDETQNFSLNLFITGFSMLLSFILSLFVFIRVVKYWKLWPNQRVKFIILGLALPAIILYIMLLFVIFSI